MSDEGGFIQSGEMLHEPALPAVLNARHVQGWNEAIETAAQLCENMLIEEQGIKRQARDGHWCASAIRQMLHRPEPTAAGERS